MTLISDSNNWALLSIMLLSSYIAIYLEQKYKWAAKMSGSYHGAKELGTWLVIIVGSILGA